MTSVKDEEAAKEFAECWKMTGFKEIGYTGVEFPLDVVEDIKRRLRNAFLAGCQHARAEQKELMEWVKRARKVYWKIGNKEHPEVYELEDAMLEIFEKLEQILPEEK